MQEGFKWWLHNERAQRLVSAKAAANQPLVCLDLTADGATSLARLSLLLEQWRKVPANTALHWVWVGKVGQFPQRPPTDLAIDPAHWPQSLPGLHRCCFTSSERSVRLTIGLGNADQLLDELVLSADLIVLDGQRPVPSLTHVSHSETVVLSVTDLAVEPVIVQQRESTDPSQPSLFAWKQAQDRGRYFAPTVDERCAVVIGAGISGLTTAAVLGARGWAIQVLDPCPPGANSRHATHLAAALTPVISSADDERSQLSRAGSLAADRFWSSLPKIIGQRCGALQLQRPQTQKRWVDLRAVSETFAWPAWARWVDAAQASDLAGMALPRGGLWMPGGWLIEVARLLEVLAQMPGVTVSVGQAHQLRRQAGGWQVLGEQAQVLAQSQTVLIANAADANGLLTRSDLWPPQDVPVAPRLGGLHRLAGEITCLPAQRLGGGPACIVGGDGYVLPAVNGWCVSGGTYVREATQAQCTPQGQQTNLQRAADLLNLPSLVEDLRGEALPGWAGFRAVLPGRLPAIGPLLSPCCEGLWMQTAGASRGLTWSVLGAELIADALEGAPLALQKSLLQRLLPGI